MKSDFSTNTSEFSSVDDAISLETYVNNSTGYKTVLIVTSSIYQWLNVNFKLYRKEAKL